MKKEYFAYIRVSTARQGEHGVSLQQQREAIERHAARAGLAICQWLEEQETAAKRGRPVFTEMIRRLRKGDAVGVIMHKIDRSARNLRDWADLGDLIDAGIEVHFANEPIDLKSRGGRLSADIQAVVAADYVRNLREETIKGFYGRLSQGVLPLPAPLGYMDAGAGKPKTVDPVQGPAVQNLFDLYATGRYSLRTITPAMYRLGLRTKKGKRVSRNVIHRTLSNPFYIGLIRIRKKNKLYPGAHETLIPKSVFDRVQAVLSGKRISGTTRQLHFFSRMIQCASCGYSLIGELHKGHVYYRCHTKPCPITSFREEQIHSRLQALIERVALRPQEAQILDEVVADRANNCEAELSAEIEAYRLQLSGLTDRHNRLTDAFIDGTLDKVDYEQRKAALLLQRRDLEEKLTAAGNGRSAVRANIAKYVELVKRASLLVKGLHAEEMRDWLEEAMSNRTALAKTLMFTLKDTLSEVAERPSVPIGGPPRETSRIFWSQWIEGLANRLDDT